MDAATGLQDCTFLVALLRTAANGIFALLCISCGIQATTMTTASQIREHARESQLTKPTIGLAPGHIQANLLILPSSVASDFELLCARNPVPCPLIGKSTRAGDSTSFTPSNLFSHSIDIRKDLPQYNVYENGVLLKSKTDIADEWTDDSVAFLVGCSFSFEDALTKAGLPPRQIEQKCNATMYRTKIKLNPAGVFVGATMVVSMRPYLLKDVEKVRHVTRPFVKTHGEPVAWGWEAVTELGIEDMDKPDFGDLVEFREGEVPVFWGCGRSHSCLSVISVIRVRHTLQTLS